MSESKSRRFDNIYQRVNAVQRAVKYVQKDAAVQNYKAVTHDAVTAALRPEMVKAGIVIQPEQVKGKIISEWQSKSGANFHRYRGDYIIHFVNIDDPKDRISIPMQAHADDNGDKAPGKSCSYATKFATLKLFSLETGESDESRNAEPYSQEQFEVFHDLIDQKKAYELYLFMATLPPESASGLNSSFPDGKITQGKKALRELSQEGQAQFAAVVEDLQAKLAAQDPAALEVTGEMSTVEKRFLMSRLSDFEIRALKKMKESASE